MIYNEFLCVICGLVALVGVCYLFFLMFYKGVDHDSR